MPSYIMTQQNATFWGVGTWQWAYDPQYNASSHQVS